MNRKSIILMLAFFSINTIFGAGQADVNQLLKACIEGNIEAIKKLCNEDLNFQELQSKNADKTALCIACERGRTKIAEFLLSKDIDPNQSHLIFNDSKLTALGLACFNGHKEIVELLLASKKIDPNKTHNTLPNGTQLTALGIACFNGHKEIIELLLSQNVDPKAIHCTFANDSKLTALAVACFKGHKEIVKLLLNKGSVFKRVDSDGSNAYQVPGITDEIKQVIKNHAIKDQDTCLFSMEPFFKGQSLHFLGCCTTFVGFDAFLEWQQTKWKENQPLSCPCCGSENTPEELDTFKYPFEETKEQHFCICQWYKGNFSFGSLPEMKYNK